MSARLLRSVAGLLVAVAVVSAGAGTARAFTTAAGHAGMPCCDEPDDCAARLSALSCCGPGHGPDATVPPPVAVSVTVVKVAPDLPAGQPVGCGGLLSSTATDAFGLASLKLPHDPPYLLHSVLLI